MSDTALFSTEETLRLLNIPISDLDSVMIPKLKKNGKSVPALFVSEHFSNREPGEWVFTQRDLIKLSRYFKALKEYRFAKQILKQSHKDKEVLK